MMGASPKNSKTLIMGLERYHILDISHVFDVLCWSRKGVIFQDENTQKHDTHKNISYKNIIKQLTTIIKN